MQLAGGRSEGAQPQRHSARPRARMVHPDGGPVRSPPFSGRLLPSLAETTPVADLVTNAPNPDDLARAEKFTREPFVYAGEDPAVALAPGAPRRVALDSALADLDAGASQPSVEWRRRWSLLLGLERLLSEEAPKLVDGTVRSAHQVDALSG